MFYVRQSAARASLHRSRAPSSLSTRLSAYSAHLEAFFSVALAGGLRALHTQWAPRFPLRSRQASSGVACLFLFLSILLSPRIALAREVIESFNSDIVVNDTGGLTVTETLALNAEDVRFDHGIYRDFGLGRTDGAARISGLGFSVLQATRDGMLQAVRVERRRDSIRVWIGSDDETLVRGRHIYVLKIRTEDQVSVGKTEDELAWEVTGSNWPVPILDVSATVHLPHRAGAAFAATPATVKTWADFKPEPVHTTVSDDGSTLDFRYPRSSWGQPIAHTIAVRFPSDVIHAASKGQRGSWFVQAYLGDLILASTLLAVALLYVVCLIRARSKPANVPSATPDDWLAVSPALARRLIDSTGPAEYGLHATLIDLSMRGYLTLSTARRVLTLQRTDKPLIRGQLSVEAAGLLRALEKRPEWLTLSTSAESNSRAMRRYFATLLERSFDATFLGAHTTCLLLGIVLSVAAETVAFFLQAGTLWEFQVLAPACCLMVGIVLGVTAFRKKRRGWLAAVTLPYLIAMISVQSVIEFFYLFNSLLADSLEAIVCVLLLGLIHPLAGIYLKRLGAIGKRRRTQFMMLRRNLAADHDAWTGQGGEPSARQPLDVLLPYAVAFGVAETLARSSDKTMMRGAIDGYAALLSRLRDGSIHSGMDSHLLADHVGTITAVLSWVLEAERTHVLRFDKRPSSGASNETYDTYGTNSNTSSSSNGADSGSSSGGSGGSNGDSGGGGW